jgi:hypothetical protein
MNPRPPVTRTSVPAKSLRRTFMLVLSHPESENGFASPVLRYGGHRIDGGNRQQWAYGIISPRSIRIQGLPGLFVHPA